MQHSRDGGVAYVNKIVTLGASVFVVITIIATVLAPFLVFVYSSRPPTTARASTPAQTDLAVAFAFWCLPQILFYALYSLLGEVLNARSSYFGPFTWAPLINNVIAIAGLVVFIALFGGQDVNSSVDAWTCRRSPCSPAAPRSALFDQAAFLPFFWKRAGLTFGGLPVARCRPQGHRHRRWLLFAMILVTKLAGIVQSRVPRSAPGPRATRSCRTRGCCSCSRTRSSRCRSRRRTSPG